MRRYLSREMRHRFDVAWYMLPYSASVLLKSSIVAVREGHPLNAISFPIQGGRFGPDEEGAGWCGSYCRDGGTAVVLAFSSELKLQNEPLAIANMLHELAHAYHYVTDGYDATLLGNERAEVGAWAQAAAWSAFEGSGYALAADVTTWCLGLAHQDLKDWHERRFADLVKELPKTW